MEHKCNEINDKSVDDDCPYLTAAYILAGLSMMLNIRLAYSSAPYALIRFRLYENLFSVFVRRMASALELWCLPSMLLGNIVDLTMKIIAKNTTVNYDGFPAKLNAAGDETNLINNKKKKFNWIIVPSMVTMWLDFLTYVVLLIIYVTGGDQGYVTGYYGVIAVSGFVFGINMTLVYAADWRYIPVYIAGENSFPAVTSLMHYLTTLIFGNRRKWNSDFIVVCVDICVAIIISFTTATLWTCAHVLPPDSDATATNIKTPGGSTSPQGRGTDNTKFSSLKADGEGLEAKNLWHIKPPDPIDDQPYWGPIISPALMVIVGMGLVYAIYPGIAPGMIVPFYLVDKIEMILLIGTIFPPVIVAMLIKYAANWSPKTKYVWHGEGKDNGFGGWRPYPEHVPTNPEGDPPDFSCNDGAESKPENLVHAWIWHLFDIMIVIKISLAIIFIYSLHYRDSSISRSIVDQPKMSTFLTIVFYMCHESLLALGFQGIVGNKGATYVMLPAQYVGALFMIFLAFYSEGYIIEYKSHDPADWPTELMCYVFGIISRFSHWVVDFPLIVIIMIKFNVCSDGYYDFK